MQEGRSHWVGGGDIRLMGAPWLPVCLSMKDTRAAVSPCRAVTEETASGARASTMGNGWGLIGRCRSGLARYVTRRHSAAGERHIGRVGRECCDR